MGVLAPGSAHPRPYTPPPLTWTEIFCTYIYRVTFLHPPHKLWRQPRARLTSVSMPAPASGATLGGELWLWTAVLPDWCTLLYTISTHFAVSQSVLQNQFTELGPSVITILNRVDQSQSLTSVRNSYTDRQTPHSLKSAIHSMADLKIKSDFKVPIKKQSINDSWS